MRVETGVKIVVSEPVRLNPFDNPAAFPAMNEKILSKDEVFSFTRYLLFETNYFTSQNKTYIGDYFEIWQKRQQAKHWD